MRASPRGVACVALLAAAFGIGSSVPVGRAEAALFGVDVRDYGAVGDGSTDDTAAVQRANDAVARSGGGRVVFPAGTYIVRRVVMDSDVEFYGSGAVLKHPDGYSSAILTSRTRDTRGSISKGSRLLRVANAAGIRPGVAVAIRGAGQRISGQTTSHPFHYSYIESVSGSTLVIARAAVSDVVDATVFTGTINTAIRGLTLDGNQPTSSIASAVVPIDLRLARKSVISGCVIRNGIHGGVRLDFGSRDNRIERSRFLDNGRPAERRGAAVWLFRGATANIVRDNEILGGHYHGIAVDDRTEETTEWDAPSNSNWIARNDIDIASATMNVGISITGSSYNTIKDNVLSSVQTGLGILNSTQGTHGRVARRNHNSGNVLSSHTAGIYVTGSENDFSENSVSRTAIPYTDAGSGNTATW